VFQTGAGEPTRDTEWALQPRVLKDTFVSFPDRFRRSPKYVEFRANAEIDDDQFAKQTIAASLLRLAQQIVHAHANMGLPQGDFAPVASSDVLVPSSVAAVVSQFGEWSSPSIGTRFLLRDYEGTVSRLVFSAEKIWFSGDPVRILARSWLPMSSRDGTTQVVVAERLNAVLSSVGVSVLPSVLEDAVLSGEVPDAWEGVKSFLGPAPEAGERDIRDRFDFLFKSYADVGQFTTAFTNARNSAVLAELALPWASPSAGHLDWSYNAKVRFSAVADQWARVSAAYAHFFELSSGVAARSVSSGSEAQLATVSVADGVTIVRTSLALSAPEFSLAACFPASGLFVGGNDRKVVLTTPLNVSQRGTEFCQRDWR